MAGRFAPSPTGPLHLGNLRTAVLAWVAARAAGLEFLIRIEDLMRIPESDRHEQSHLADLATLGITSDRPPIRQSERGARYAEVVADLQARDLVYECFCTRREIAAEIAAAANAPHEPVGALPDRYPGTCARLDAPTRARRRREGRPPALRLRADGVEIGGIDQVWGPVRAVVDDFVIRRGDGVAAYNLAVVVDDAEQNITQVVRGDDLLASTPRQILLQRLLGVATPAYIHLPLVVGPDGQRLAKRHGAVTLADQRALGRCAGDLLAGMVWSSGLVTDHPQPGRIEGAPVDALRGQPGPLDLSALAAHLAGMSSAADGRSDNSIDWGVIGRVPIQSSTL